MLWLLKNEIALYAEIEERVVTNLVKEHFGCQMGDSGRHMKNWGVKVKFSSDHRNDST